ncbi:hypothetical protein GN958_ATG20877 [Phytophthora infestans]|uniref:Uncharacterized protein n=1 Tax=Phytophthora infestans TaxID=4787 RepID=A0A8S9TN55_PHYIN|nr:hypothetical protein GN958_ATG20877 [Phytophthora infestans]
MNVAANVAAMRRAPRQTCAAPPTFTGSGALGYILGEKCVDDLYCGRHHECAADLGLDCDRNHNSAADLGLSCDRDHDHDCAGDLDCGRDETYSSDVTYVAKLRCPESLGFACVWGCAEIS